jgi:hypothetical protein
MGRHGLSAQDVPRASARQRVIVLTFPTPEDADAWDAAGQPFALWPNVDMHIPPGQNPCR